MDASTIGTEPLAITRENRSIWPVTRKFALFAALTLILHQVIGQFTVFSNDSSATIVSLYEFLIWPILMVFAWGGVSRQRLLEDGVISFGRAFKISAGVVILAILISLTYSFIYLLDAYAQSAKTMQDFFYEIGAAEEEVAQMAKNSGLKYRWMMVSGTILMNFFQESFFGLGISLAVAALLRRKPPLAKT